MIARWKIYDLTVRAIKIHYNQAKNLKLTCNVNVDMAIEQENKNGENANCHESSTARYF